MPHVRQNTALDCGAACLTSVLRFHGFQADLAAVREACGIGRDGTTAFALTQGAARFGLRARGVSLDVDAIRYLPPGSILHWEFQHFVVFEGVRRDGIEIVDPALGRRRVPHDAFARSFTGVALVLEKASRFEPMSRRVGGLTAYVRRLLGHRALLTRILLTTALIQSFGLGLPILTGVLVDRVVPWNDYHLLEVIGVGLALVLVCQMLTSLMRSHLLLHLRTQVDAQMTLDFLDHMVGLPYAFFQQRSAGDLMMRLNSNTTVREMLTASTLSGALDGMLVVTYLIVLMVIQPILGALVLALGVLRITVFVLARTRIRHLMSESLALQATSQAYQVQMLAGMETLKASGSESRAVEKWTDLFVDVLNVSLKRGRLAALVQALLDGLSFASPLLVLIVGGLLVMQGRLSLGGMLAMSALAAGFLSPLGSLMSSAIQFQEAGSYVERLNDVLLSEREQDSDSVRPAPDLKGRITLDSVTFRYSTHAAAAIDDVSLEIAPGRVVAIIGRSAAGKSTLASLLVSLYRPTSGRVMFDDHDLAHLDVRRVRQQIGIVTQHPFLFGTSIRDNIALAHPRAGMDEIERAAKLAHIHDEIASMPMGYDTLLIDGGQSLSGGQRQRIALARALVGTPRILVLDEATSALDADLERRIQESLADLKCTRIVIAHRLTTIRSADEIVVLDAGRIVERGTHAELLSREGVYRELLGHQVALG